MPSPVNRLLQPSVDVQQDASGSTAHLSAESLNADNTFADLANISAAVRSPSGVVTNTVLSQVAPGRYEGDMKLGEPGAYQAVITREGDTPVSETAGFTVQSSQELMNAGTNDRLLARLARAAKPTPPTRRPRWICRAYPPSPRRQSLCGNISWRRVWCCSC